MNVFIVGCGYVGARVAALEQQAGAHVAALARSPESAERLTVFRVRPVPGDLDKPETLNALPLKDAVLYYFAPPPEQGHVDTRMQNFTRALTNANRPARAVLISTTGVYGDCRGEWITEARAVNPRAPRAERRVSAEAQWHAWGRRAGVPVVVLRVAGIYGPGRLPLERLRRGEPVLQETEAPYSNRVHVHDLAQACFHAARRGEPDTVINVTDGNPTTMTDFFYRVADACGIARPRAVSLAEAKASFSAGLLSYLAESKRIGNKKMIEELGVTPRFPTLEAGLTDCVRQVGVGVTEP